MSEESVFGHDAIKVLQSAIRKDQKFVLLVESESRSSVSMHQGFENSIEAAKFIEKHARSYRKDK